MRPMSDTFNLIDYERMTLAELEFASQAATPDQKRFHLNQASVFAALGEKQRGAHPGK
jgi:hypothetical protein